MLPLLFSVLLGPSSRPAGPSFPRCGASPAGREIPSTFVGGRIFARMGIGGADTLSMYTDTGGSTTLYPSAVRRLGVALDSTPWNQGDYHGVRLSARVPASRIAPDFPVMPGLDSAPIEFLVQDEPAPDEEAGVAWDGRLGSWWFSDRVWTIDYPHHHLYFNGTDRAGPTRADCWLPLGFQVDSAGHRTTNIPRVTAIIDHQRVEFMLDTGARTELTDSAWHTLGPDLPLHRAASFITTDRLEQWHSAHPDWLVVADAETHSHARMIRVPAITIGARQVGPVWFTERATRIYREMMAPVMDRPIEGSLGPSAFGSSILIIDYPRARLAVLSGNFR